MDKWQKQAKELLNDPWGHGVANDVVDGIAVALTEAYKAGRTDALASLATYYEELKSEGDIPLAEVRARLWMLHDEAALESKEPK